MLCVDSKDYFEPQKLTDNQGRFRCWVLRHRSHSEERRAQQLNYTYVSGALDGLDCLGDLEVNERLTVTFESNGNVKPSGRSLRVYGNALLSPIIRRLYGHYVPRPMAGTPIRKSQPEIKGQKSLLESIGINTQGL